MAGVTVDCPTHTKRCFISETQSVEVGLVLFNAGKQFLMQTSFLNHELCVLSFGPTEACRHANSGKVKVKVKVKLPLFLIKYHTLKAYGGVQV
jgi:hypothetical protein